jgi:hypothetical protein
MSADIVTLGAASISAAGIITWQAAVEIGNDNDDVEPFGQPDVIQSLGVASLPYPKDNEGRAEGLILRDCGGKDGVCIGARDTRNAKLVGKMGPGDTTLHSTGPGSVAQCFLKHKKKQAGLATDDVDGKSMMFLLDGKNKKAQLAARGAIVEIAPNGDISIINKQGTGILIQGGKIVILGELSLPGMTPGMALVQGAPIPQPPGPIAAGQFTPVLGVSK